jgi:hypothetical protein
MKDRICHCFDTPIVSLIAMIVILILFMKLGFKVAEINERHHAVFTSLPSRLEQGK